MKYYVYIIKSKEGFHFTGFTEDLEKRLFEHNEKKLSFWTKRGTNWKLIYKEEFNNKTGVGRDFLKNNLSDY